MTAPTPTPALMPPPGATYDPTSSTVSAMWKWNVFTQTACLFFASIFFILRTYIRACVKQVWILEDYLCCCAFMGLVLYSGLLTAIVYMGGGTHQWELTTPQVERILYYVNLIQVLYSPAAASTKSAILLLYLRIFSPRRWSKLNVTIRAFILIVCLFYVALSFAKIFQCLPRARIWDKSVPGKCVELVILLDVSGLFNIISDVSILLVPLKGVWSLQMSKKRKIAVYVVFTVGAIAPLFSIIGFVKRFQLGSSPDKSYNQVIILLWATAELAIGVMVICFPTLPGLLHSRTKKPSQSIVNGSARSPGPKAYLPRGRRSTDEQNTLVEGEYFVLGEARAADQAHVKVPHSAFVNEISRGSDGGGDEQHSDVEEYMPSNGILKTVRIEQSNV